MTHGLQIDAAINPGNSGGPAFADLDAGKVAGVAFSKNVSTSTDNIGYIIPWRVVEHFMTEAATGDGASYRGVPDPGFSTQDMENPSQRTFLKVGLLQRHQCSHCYIDSTWHLGDFHHIVSIYFIMVVQLIQQATHCVVQVYQSI